MPVKKSVPIQMNPFLEDPVAVAEDRAREKPHRLLFTLSDRTVIVIIIYVSLFLDNVLLTLIGELN